MRRGYQIAILDQQIMDRRHRQIQLEALPTRAVIERDIDPRFRARIQAARGAPGHSE